MWGGVVTIDIFDWNQYFSIAFLLRKINIDEVTHLVFREKLATQPYCVL